MGAESEKSTWWLKTCSQPPQGRTKTRARGRGPREMRRVEPAIPAIVTVEGEVTRIEVAPVV